jgi:hypothetical protein
VMSVIRVCDEHHKNAPAGIRINRQRGPCTYRQPNCARVGHHPATSTEFLQSTAASELPAEGQRCRKTRRALKSKKRIKGGILTDCRHLRFYCVWFPPCCFTTGVSCGTRENVWSTGGSSRPIRPHEENGQNMRWCYCRSAPSAVLLRAGTALHGSGLGARVRGGGADRRSMCPRRLYGCESLVLGSRRLVPTSA